MEREVRVGDRTIVLTSLSGFRVLRAGKALARITQKVTGVDEQIQEFVSSYRAANSEKVTRAVFEYRQGLEEAARLAARREELAERPDDEAELELEQFRQQLVRQRLSISAEAWEKSGNEVELSRDPSPLEIGAFLLPQVLDQAEDEVVRLLALVASPDSELREAKREGRYDDYLEEKGETLLFEGDVEQLLELAAVTAEVLGEKLSGKAQRLRTAWSRLTGANQEPEQSSTSGESSSGISSTPSEEPMDGTPTPSSSATGSKSSVSASG